MPRNFDNEGHQKAKARITRILGENGFEYMRGGKIVSRSTAVPARQLEDLIRDRDLGGVNDEFERALAGVTGDPGAAVTAACSILEALFKVYISDEKLELPTDQSINPLWKVVQSQLGFDPKAVEDDDLKKVLGGLTSIVQGLGSFRTHTGSAHGRGRPRYKLEPRHARVVVNAAHSLAIFVIESWDKRSEK